MWTSTRKYDTAELSTLGMVEDLMFKLAHCAAQANADNHNPAAPANAMHLILEWSVLHGYDRDGVLHHLDYAVREAGRDAA